MNATVDRIEKPLFGLSVQAKKILSTSGQRPGSEYVIAYGKNQKVVSKYGDNVWDFSAYQHGSGYAKINFDACRSEHSKNFDAALEEIKWLIFTFITHNNRGRGGVLSAGTVMTLWKLSLRKLLEYSISNGVEIRQILENEATFRKYIVSTNMATTLPSLSSLLKIMLRVGVDVTGYSIFTGKTLDEMRAYVKKEFPHNQTPVIPSRLLSICIERNELFLDDFLRNSDNLMSFFLNVKNDRGYGVSVATQAKYGITKVVEIRPQFQAAINEHKLTDLCEKHKINSISQFSRYLKSVQYASKTIIHAYTGMRDGEALTLPLDCLKKEKYAGRVIRRISGITTKLEATSSSASWVTSVNAVSAVEAAQKIHEIVSLFRLKGEDRLFITTSELSILSGKLKPAVGNKSFCLSREYHQHNIPIIESDIQELQRYSPLYDWQSDPEYAVDSIWSFSSHQFRRSLAFYAAQSGLVSLPSLKRQLHHISLEMSIYYAKGASAPRSMFTNVPGHIIDEFREIKPEADGVAFLYNVLLSDEKLHGPFGNIIERTEKQADEITILANREETIKRFRRGEIAYKKMPTGVCTSVEPCDRRAGRSIAACTSCEKAIIKEPKLNLAIESQSKLVSKLDNNSMEHRIETAELLDLKSLQKRIRNKSTCP